MHEVTLTWSELTTAANIAVRRQVQNLAKGRKDRWGFCGDGWGVHIEGACGEMAVAKLLNIYWTGNLNRLRDADVGKLEVRTRSNHDYDLLLHKTDDPDASWILVTGKAPVFVVHGWIAGRAGMMKEYWKDPAKGRPAYFVPKSELEPIESLHK